MKFYFIFLLTFLFAFNFTFAQTAEKTAIEKIVCLIKDIFLDEGCPTTISLTELKTNLTTSEKIEVEKKTSIVPVIQQNIDEVKIRNDLLAFVGEYLDRQTDKQKKVEDAVRQRDLEEKLMHLNKKIEDNVYRAGGYGGWYPSYTNQNNLIGISTIGYLNSPKIDSPKIEGASFSGAVTMGGDTNITNLNTTNLSSNVFYAASSSLVDLQFRNATGTNITATGTASLMNIISTSSIIGSATITNATTTNIYGNNASITSATTTNFFTNIFNAINATLENLLFRNATGTNITATGTAYLANIISTSTSVSSNLNVGTTTSISGKIARFIGDIDVTGTIDPTRILFSNLSGVDSPSYNPSGNGNNYKIEFTEGGNLNFQSNSTSNILQLLNNGKVGLGVVDPTLSLSIGDNDTGISWINDGVLTLKQNANERIRINGNGVAVNLLVGTVPAFDFTVGDDDTGIDWDTDGVFSLKQNNNKRLTVSGSGVGVNMPNSDTPNFELAIGDNDTGIDWDSDGQITLKGNNNAAIRIKSNGQVEMDQTLRVSGQAGGFNDGAAATTFCAKCDNTGGTSADDSVRHDYTGADFSIYANERIGANLFMAFSDSRIKNIIGTSSSLNDLFVLNSIAVKDYYLKDDIYYKGLASSTSQKKVIAQELENVAPNLVTKTEGFVQLEEMLPATVQVLNGKKQIVSTHTPLENGKMYKYAVIQDGTTGEFVAGNETTLEEGAKLVISHIKVEDFRTVDYDGLTTLNISATQELYKLVKEGSGFTKISTTSNREEIINLIQNELELVVGTTTQASPVDVLKNKIKDGYDVVRQFAALQIVAARGYFDKLFAKEILVESLCVGNQAEKICLTKEQLGNLINNASNNNSAPNLNPDPAPQPQPNSESI